ncbi:MAG: S8 family serine peptidase, partial [Acidobacteriota bacterium]
MGILSLAGLDLLWRESLGDPRICIAVLDGPVDLSHTCFATTQFNEITTVASDSTNQVLPSQHGTHVASVIFGKHSGPIRGIAPSCRGLSIPIFSQITTGPTSLSHCSQLDLARAIRIAVQQGAQVINISAGVLTASGEAEPLLADTVRLCAANNVLIVAAAGNDGCDCLHIPAALSSVLVVGAMNSQGLPMDTSNWSERYQTQGILAPGENILGALPGNEVALRSGTSFATAIVSGIVGLLLSIELKQ